MRNPFLLLILIIGFINPINAQWSTHSTVNNAISTFAENQDYPLITTDGLGGSIICWRDDQNSPFSDIYAQRINEAGMILWSLGGIPICTASGHQFPEGIISDGVGGAIIVWVDIRNGTDSDVYAQRVNSSGIVLWTSDGVAISTESGFQEAITITSDGTGGALITWMDGRNGIDRDIYCQRINSSGIVQLSSSGVPICTASYSQAFPSISSDGSGGAIISWHDLRNGMDSDVYAQRISSTGLIQWTSGGIPISTLIGDQRYPKIISDDAGGAIITWVDQRNGLDLDVYAQRVDSTGFIKWTSDGMAVCTAPNSQNTPTISSDGLGGAIMTWSDLRNGLTDPNIYAQRVSVDGLVQWPTNGVEICNAMDLQFSPEIISDGTGGGIITWEDRRNGNDFDIYAQRINADGNVQWSSDGVPISTIGDEQEYPQLISDGGAGAIITWMDKRNGSDYDIYAQNIGSGGSIGVVGVEDPFSLPIVDINPNPTSDLIRLNLPSTIVSNRSVNVSLLNLYGKEYLSTPVIDSETELNLSTFPTGVYLLKVTMGPEVFTKRVVKN